MSYGLDCSVRDALKLATDMGYEFERGLDGRWRWRHAKWNAGVRWARSEATLLDALDAVARRGRQEEVR